MKPYEIKDIKLFHELSIDPFVRKYLWDDEIISIQLAQEIVHKSAKLFRKSGFGIWKLLLKQSQEIIGYAGLWHFFAERQPQLIYALLEKHTRKGLAVEAARSISTYCFENLNYQYLIASMDVENRESMHVAERIGMSEYERRSIDDKLTVFYKVEKT